MNQKIATLAIERFRALRKLEIEGLGRVNLITGRNNTGKSSILEALRILAADASRAVIYSILRDREENVGESEETVRPIDADGPFLVSSLFHGFPRLSEKPKPIVISAIDGQCPMQLTMDLGWVTEQRQEDGSRRLVPLQKQLFGEGETVPALIIHTAGERRILSLESMRRFLQRGRFFGSDLLDEPQMACYFVSPYGGERTGTLGPLWDKIALSDLEGDVVDALRIIDPEISAVSMVGGEGPRDLRAAIVKAKGFSRPVPLRSFGDGLNRLFGIALSLVNARDGLLLIDEFENGMHHTIQIDVWRAIFRLASRLDIQVFATSHSWDSIEAFQEAAAEHPEEGVLIRLSRSAEDVIATLFREDELAVVSRERIEVR